MCTSCGNPQLLPPAVPSYPQHVPFYVLLFCFGNNTLSPVTAACWNADSPCWLDLVQVIIATVSLWVLWPCHGPNTVFSHPLAFMFFLLLSDVPFNILSGEAGLMGGIDVPLRTVHLLDTRSTLSSCESLPWLLPTAERSFPNKAEGSTNL